MSPANGLSSTTKTNSAPTLRTKLDPLPGSPLHDETLNPAKPLPPAPIQAFAATNPILGKPLPPRPIQAFDATNPILGDNYRKC